MKSDKSNKQTHKLSLIQRSTKQVGFLVLPLITFVFISACGGSTANAVNNPVENTVQVTESPTEIVEEIIDDSGVDGDNPSNTDVVETEPSEINTPEGEEIGSLEELIAQGEDLFQNTAGGIGCQACHGRDALGDIGPNILGKSAETIQVQLDTNDIMYFIILSPQEVEAIAAYLAWLEEEQQ